MRKKPISKQSIVLLAAILFLGCTKISNPETENTLASETLSIINQTFEDDGTEDQGDMLGYDVDLDKTYSIVGSPGYDDLLLTDRGCAYIYSRPGAGSVWSEKTMIKNANAKPLDNFGHHVAISDNYAVAATNDSIYFFKRIFGDFWVQQNAFVPNNLPAEGLSVSSIDIYGDNLIVGHGSRRVNGNNDVGAVYFFKRINNNWVHQNTFFSPNNQRGDRFGSAVSIHGNYAVVGSRGHIQYSTHGGKAYVFMQFLGNWTQQATITAADIQINDNYGCAVAIRGEYAVIGASQESSAGQRKGGAYIFKRNGSTWTQQVKLQSSDGLVNGMFGKAVAINNNYALIGGGGEDHTNRGSIYTFNRSGTSWNFLREDNNPLADRLYFGSKLGMDSLQHYIVGGSHKGAISFGTHY